MSSEANVFDFKVYNHCYEPALYVVECDEDEESEEESDG